MAMESGIVAAKSCSSTCSKENAGTEAGPLRRADPGELAVAELYKVRNIRPAFKKGLWIGFPGGTAPSLPSCSALHAVDHASPRRPQRWATERRSEKIDYPKPDGKITFDRLSSVFLGNQPRGNRPAATCA